MNSRGSLQVYSLPCCRPTKQVPDESHVLNSTACKQKVHLAGMLSHAIMKKVYAHAVDHIAAGQSCHVQIPGQPSWQPRHSMSAVTKHQRGLQITHTTPEQDRGQAGGQ